jgi:hypothetical protein
VTWCGGRFGGSWVCICSSPSWDVSSRVWAPCAAAVRPIAGVSVPFWAPSGGCFLGDITRERIRLGHSDARPAGAACHVADPRWRFGPEPQVDVDNRREPFCAKQVDQSSAAGPGQLRSGKSLALSVFGRCGLENAEF